MKRIVALSIAAMASAVLARAQGPVAAPATRTNAAPPAIRARDLGVPFEGTPGSNNAITDVPGVEVGFTTLISGDGPLVVGQGPVRTGVTAVLPRGKNNKDPVFGGFFSQNGNGEMTGTEWLIEGGFLEGPVMITNTHSVGVVRDAVIAWEVKHQADQEPKGVSTYPWSLPVVAETFDGGMNDVNGFHVHPEDTFHALDAAASGPVAEGNVGGGTGMRCFGFKGGTGTASRVLPADQGGYTVGVLVQCNTGSRSQLHIAGVPVGKLITASPSPVGMGFPTDPERDVGSIIIVVATNAPLVSAQLDRLCKRATLGLGRVGGTSGDGSGDIFMSFSTANPLADDIGIHAPGAKGAPSSPVAHIDMLHNDEMDPLFLATIQATEEAIVNALVGAQTMTGPNGRVLQAVPHDQLKALMQEKFRTGTLVDVGPSKEERPTTGRNYRTDRTEGISDGVFAVSLTLLILDVRPPDGGASQLVHGLVLIAPRLGTFALSFAIVSYYWLVHHLIFASLRGVKVALIWANMLFLFTVAVLPFSTAVLGRYPLTPVALAIYGANLVACTATLAGVWFVADHARVTEHTTASQRRYIVRRFGVQLIVAVLGTACAFVAPAVALSIFVALPIAFALTYRRQYY